MAVLEDWSRRSPGLPPSGFIFHMSRCGSTLVSQLLAALPESLVVSEAGPLDALARAHLRAPGLSPGLRIDWLRAMVSALGQPRSGSELRYFIKFDARTTFELPLLRQAFPDVPWIFVYRDPVEVMVSLAASPNALTTPGMGEPLPGLPMTPEEYAARILGMLCDAAGRQFPGGRGQLVNYRHLPDLVWRDLPRHFGFPAGAREIDAMQAAALRHAKDPRRPFEPDAARRQAEASPVIRRAAEQWALPQYEQLEELRGQGLA